MSSKDKKAGKFFDSKFNRTAVIAVEIAVLLTIVVVTCAILQGDILETFAEPTKYVIQYQPEETEDNDVGDDDVIKMPSGLFDNPSVSETKKPGDSSSTDYGKKPSSNTKLESPAKWSKADIISKAKSSVNKTKSYTKPLVVHHKESFNATVTECTGGSLVKSIANTMVGWVVKPVDETLSYQNGRAINSEGENVPIILPKRGSFNLSSSGVKSASAKIVGNEYVIKLNLISESVGIGDVPSHNAGAIGYLDVNNFDISFMEIDSADITYSGSSIELHINSDGYVTYAVYKVPLRIDGSAHKGSISGSATFVGEQSEIWTLTY